MRYNSGKKWKPDVDRAWQIFYAHVREEALVPMEEQEVIKKSSQKEVLRKRAMRWSVAAILCALCIGIATFFWLQSSSAALMAIQNIKDNEVLVTTLPDGSVVFLSEGGKITHPRSFARDQRRVALEGEAFFEVTKDKRRPFIVETELTTIEVVGTSFRIRDVQDRPFELTVRSGAVKAVLKSDEHQVFVEAGERVRLVANWFQKSYVEEIHVLREGARKLYFIDEPLAQIVHAVNECAFGEEQLALEDGSLGTRMFTLTLEIESMERVADLLCTAYGLKKTVRNDVIYIGKQ